ncbi:hypothetical protein [Klebsiella pneumoniae]|uniref:hypothetical protein n=1 Tax=Klebsiella pneumoniae TaxID=573 RepID=UPI001D0DB700|nr:hypothetical protein [Klebsiella pneumoniae]
MAREAEERWKEEDKSNPEPRNWLNFSIRGSGCRFLSTRRYLPMARGVIMVHDLQKMMDGELVRLQLEIKKEQDRRLAEKMIPVFG